EGDQVEHFAGIDKKALDLVGNAAPSANELPLVEAQRGDTRLQAKALAAARLGHGEEESRDVDVLEGSAALDHVGAEPADVRAKVEGTVGRAAGPPRGRLESHAVAARPRRGLDRARGERVL